MKTIIALGIICILFMSCSNQKADKKAPLINNFNAGEKFSINLPENHITGYMWQLHTTYDNKILDYYGSAFKGNEEGVVFNFRALTIGKDTLNFALIKYRDTLEVKQFIIEIK